MSATIVRRSRAAAIADAVADAKQVLSIALLPLLAATVLWGSAVDAAAAVAAERRVALVIGNSAYRSAPTLPNPVRDAEAMATSLQRLGFEVTKGIDLDRAETELIVREFARKLPGSQVAMVFYAGHGLQVGGQNYLVPVDAELDQEMDLDFEATSLDLVLRQMEREPRVNLVFLDACRDNPLAQNLARSMGAARSTAVGRGLAVIDSSVGSFIAYATQPGNVALDGEGAHSPFTAALLQYIDSPGLSLSDLMAKVRSDVIAATAGKQVPWDHSSLTGSFYFQPASLSVAATEPAAGATTAVQSNPTVDKEVVFWESIKDSTNPADFEAYLAQFPNGTFAPLARVRVASSQANVAAPAVSNGQVAALTTDNSVATAGDQVERSLGLTRNGRSRVQLALTLLGYKTGGTDGRFGPKTRNAIMAWQADRGEDSTGYLNETQHTALLDAAASKIAAYEAEQQKKAEIAAARAKVDAEAAKKRQQQETAAASSAATKEADETKKVAAAEAEAERLRKENEELKRAQAAKEAEEQGPDVDIGLGIGVGGGGVGIFPGISLGY